MKLYSKSNAVPFNVRDNAGTYQKEFTKILKTKDNSLTDIITKTTLITNNKTDKIKKENSLSTKIKNLINEREKLKRVEIKMTKVKIELGSKCKLVRYKLREHNYNKGNEIIVYKIY